MGNSRSRTLAKFEKHYANLVEMTKSKLLELTKESLGVQRTILIFRQKAKVAVKEGTITNARTCLQGAALAQKRYDEIDTIIIQLRSILDNASSAKDSQILASHMEQVNYLDQQFMILNNPKQFAEMAQQYQQQQVTKESMKAQASGVLAPSIDIEASVEDELNMLLEAKDLKETTAIQGSVLPNLKRSVEVKHLPTEEELRNKMILLNAASHKA